MYIYVFLRIYTHIHRYPHSDPGIETNTNARTNININIDIYPQAQTNSIEPRGTQVVNNKIHSCFLFPSLSLFLFLLLWPTLSPSLPLVLSIALSHGVCVSLSNVLRDFLSLSRVALSPLPLSNFSLSYTHTLHLHRCINVHKCTHRCIWHRYLVEDTP